MKMAHQYQSGTEATACWTGVGCKGQVSLTTGSIETILSKAWELRLMEGLATEEVSPVGIIKSHVD